MVDKPLYYGLSFVTGRRAAELGLISGTQTFGHTGLLLLAFVFYAWMRKSRVMAALALGIATHLLLDNFLDHYNGGRIPGQGSALTALLFPFLGAQFPIMPFRDAVEHLGRGFKPIVLWGEVVGAALLAWDFWLKYHLESVRLGWRRLRGRRLRQREPL